MKKQYFLKDKKFYGAIFCILIICTSGTVIPVVHSSNIIQIINDKDNESIPLLNMLDFVTTIIKNSKNIDKKYVFQEFNKYLNQKYKMEISEKSCDRYINTFSKIFKVENNDLFLTILLFIIRSTDEKGIQPKQLYEQYIAKHKEALQYVQNYIKNSSKPLIKEPVIKNNDLIIPQNSRFKISQNSDYFKEYWSWYEKAKQIWAGNFVDIDGSIIERPDLIINSWNGTNFSDWYYTACDFLWGIKGVNPQSEFQNLNQNGFSIGSICLGISIVGWIAGVFGFTAGYTTGGLFGIFGAILIFILLFWDWYIMLYFLFGLNSFLMLFEWGYVDLLVQLTGDQNKINSSIVKAINLNAKTKFVETGGIFENPNIEQPVRWYISEFEYILNRYETDSNQSYYSICYPEYRYNDKEENEAHAQWEKAVPPPGDWQIIIYDKNGSILAEKIIYFTLPRENYYINIKIT